MSADRSASILPLLAILAFIAGWLAVQGFREAPIDETVDAVERPRYHLEGARWRRYDASGALVFEATAGGIDYFDDESMTLTAIDLVTRGARGSWRLEAPHGSVPAGEKRVLLGPDVDVHGEPQRRPDIDIDTPTLWVNWEARTLSTDDPVTATTPGRQLKAGGMRADWAAERVEFLGQVEASYAAP